MTPNSLQLEIPVLLPEVENERDQCVTRLQEQLSQRRGIGEVHVKRENGKAHLCIHYDADAISLSQVQRWAEQAGAQVSGRYRHEMIHISDMDCADCALSIEHILSRQKGVLDVSVNYAAEKMWVEYDTDLLDHKTVLDRVQGLGYNVEEKRAPRGWLWENWELVLSFAAGGFLAAGFFGQSFLGLSQPAAIALYLLAYLAGGYDATLHGVKAAFHLRFDIDFLMVVAAVGAAILGHWAEGALLLFLFSLGHALESYAMGRARHAIQALGEITPKMARLKRDGREREAKVEELLRGDVVIVRPGERVPIDGRVLAGRSSVDQSPITGESLPVEKDSGEEVFAGSVNGEGTLEIEVTKLSRDSTLARIIQMVEEAQAQKSPTQRFTDRLSHVFVPAVLVSVTLVILLPPIIGWLSWQEAFLRGMTILVAASPCALAIATPSAVLSGVAQAARNGVLVKGGAHLENLGALQAIALDKTGTLTRGVPDVTDVIPVDGTEPRHLLSVAAAAESRSNHPLAQAILRKAQAEGIENLPGSGELQSVTGRGVLVRLNGRVVRIGNLRLFESQERPAPEPIVSMVRDLEAGGKTTMVVQDGERFLGVIGLADQSRPAVKSTLERLHNLGIKALIMITGDNERVAAAISREVGLTDYKAGLLPDEKVTAVKELLDRYGQVAMVGDGVNDAPALAASTVGIAMGAGGTDVALETADVALMADDISRLPFAVGLSRQSRRIIQQNLIIALGVILLLIPAALFGLASIGLAILFHEGSTLLVVANALRLLGYRD
jgi:Cd2+/Zn2+-exporting ATPase